MSKRLTIPKFKSLINNGMKPNDVLEKVFKKYKGTIHDTSYWKNKIRSRINQYYKSKSSFKKSKRTRQSKSLKKSKRRIRSKSLKKSKRRRRSSKKDGFDDFPILSYYSATAPMILYK